MLNNTWQAFLASKNKDLFLEGLLFLSAIAPMLIVFLLIMKQTFSPQSMQKINMLHAYSKHLNEEKCRNYLEVEDALSHCEEVIENKTELCACLIDRGLTEKQIAILEGTTEFHVRQKIDQYYANKKNNAQK